MPLRAMIVEDESVIALELRSILEDNGHEVMGVAGTMRAALGVARAHPGLDVAVMDVALAGEGDGVETAHRLREDHGVASLFVSAKLTSDVRERAARCLPVGFVGKPFGERDILKALAALDGLRHA